MTTRPRRPNRALCGIITNQFFRTAASTRIRYGLKSTPLGSLSNSRPLRFTPGAGLVPCRDSPRPLSDSPALESAEAAEHLERLAQVAPGPASQLRVSAE